MLESARLSKTLHRRHTNKSKSWLIDKYWTATGKKWLFSVKSKYKNKEYISCLLKISTIGIKRHIKIKADANPYLRKYRDLYWVRRNKVEAK